MRLYPEKLAPHLQGKLKPVYVVSGDETLLVEESCDAIRAACRKQGYSERHVLHVEAHFEWQQVLQLTHEMSLFAERKLIELRLPSGKPGDEGAKVLNEYCKIANPDTILLVICNKLERNSSQSKWYKTLDRCGATITLWPPTLQQLPKWIQQRLQQANISADREALQVLCDRVQGNLLAADQEIEKLKLQIGDATTVNAETIASYVADNARFDVFALVDRALQGNIKQCLRNLHGLQAEGVEIRQILGVLNREIRKLCQCAELTEQGNGVERVLDKMGVWDKRKALTKKALQRLSARQLQQLLVKSQRVDAAFKGLSQDDAWLLLEQLVLELAGLPTLANAAS